MPSHKIGFFPLVLLLALNGCFAISTPRGRAVGVFSHVSVDSATAAFTGDGRVSTAETTALFAGLAALAGAVAVFFV